MTVIESEDANRSLAVGTVVHTRNKPVIHIEVYRAATSYHCDHIGLIQPRSDGRRRPALHFLVGSLSCAEIEIVRSVLTDAEVIKFGMVS